VWEKGFYLNWGNRGVKFGEILRSKRNCKRILEIRNELQKKFGEQK
jgi:hypothetical protein